MDDPTLALVKAIHRKEIERLRSLGKLPLPPWLEPTIPFAELPELPADNPYHRSWNTYRRLTGEFLSKGLAGFWLAIKGDDILGIYPAARIAAFAFAAEPDDPNDPILIAQIRANEPCSTLERLKTLCPSLPTPLAKTA
jgi:hypothetical protein